MLLKIGNSKHTHNGIYKDTYYNLIVFKAEQINQSSIITGSPKNSLRFITMGVLLIALSCFHKSHP
jgi:hypothetical protein